MNRYIRYAALIGSCLLGIGCEQSTPPAQSTFIPEATFVPASTVTLETRINGLAWDPEAYFISLVGCGPTCPFPPFISEGLPTFHRAAVTRTAISAFDPLTKATVGDPVGSLPTLGLWVLPHVPSRVNAPFFIFSAGQGELTPQAGSPPPAIAPTQYLPTLTLRPISTLSSTCTAQEAVHIGRHGVLEAVAKHLTSKGRPTQVQELLDPARYHSVAVVGLHHAGNPAVRAPADSISLEGTDGQIYYIDWAPLPADTLRSTRGYIVSEGAPHSPVGFAVVLIPNTGAAPAQVNYKFKDTKTDSVARRPWQFPPISAPPAPGVVTFIGVQMRYQPAAIPLYALPPPFAVCAPL